MFINFKAPREVPLPVQCSVLFSTAICWQWPGSRLPPVVHKRKSLGNNSGFGAAPIIARWAYILSNIS